MVWNLTFNETNLTIALEDSIIFYDKPLVAIAYDETRKPYYVIDSNEDENNYYTVIAELTHNHDVDIIKNETDVKTLFKQLPLMLIVENKDTQMVDTLPLEWEDIPKSWYPEL